MKVRPCPWLRDVITVVSTVGRVVVAVCVSGARGGGWRIVVEGVP